MKDKSAYYKYTLAILPALLLTACGGSGGDNPAPTPTNNPTVHTAISGQFNQNGKMLPGQTYNIETEVSEGDAKALNIGSNPAQKNYTLVVNYSGCMAILDKEKMHLSGNDVTYPNVHASSHMNLPLITKTTYKGEQTCNIETLLKDPNSNKEIASDSVDKNAANPNVHFSRLSINNAQSSSVKNASPADSKLLPDTKYLLSYIINGDNGILATGMQINFSQCKAALSSLSQTHTISNCNDGSGKYCVVLPNQQIESTPFTLGFTLDKKAIDSNNCTITVNAKNAIAPANVSRQVLTAMPETLDTNDNKKFQAAKAIPLSNLLEQKNTFTLSIPSDANYHIVTDTNSTLWNNICHITPVASNNNAATLQYQVTLTHKNQSCNVWINTNDADSLTNNKQTPPIEIKAQGESFSYQVNANTNMYMLVKNTTNKVSLNRFNGSTFQKIILDKTLLDNKSLRKAFINSTTGNVYLSYTTQACLSKSLGLISWNGIKGSTMQPGSDIQMPLLTSYLGGRINSLHFDNNNTLFMTTTLPVYTKSQDIYGSVFKIGEQSKKLPIWESIPSSRYSTSNMAFGRWVKMKDQTVLINRVGIFALNSQTGGLELIKKYKYPLNVHALVAITALAYNAQKNSIEFFPSWQLLFNVSSLWSYSLKDNQPSLTGYDNLNFTTPNSMVAMGDTIYYTTKQNQHEIYSYTRGFWQHPKAITKGQFKQVFPRLISINNAKARSFYFVAEDNRNHFGLYQYNTDTQSFNKLSSITLSIQKIKSIQLGNALSIMPVAK